MTDQPRLFSRPLEFVGARRAAVVAEQLEVYREFQPVANDTYFNYRERVFRSAGVTLRTSPLGSFGTDGSWLWAWANEHTCPPGSPERELSLRLRQIGERIGAPELVAPRLELGGFANPRVMAERLAVISMGLLSMPGYAVTVMPTGARQFSMIEDESVPLAPCPRPHLMYGRLMSATEVFPAAPHETAIEYLRHHGFLVTVPDATTVLATRDPGWAIAFGFDPDTGLLLRCEVTEPAAPGQPPRPPVLVSPAPEAGPAGPTAPPEPPEPEAAETSPPAQAEAETLATSETSATLATSAEPEPTAVATPEQAEPQQSREPGDRAEPAEPAQRTEQTEQTEQAQRARRAPAEPTPEQRAYLNELTDLINEIGGRLERALPDRWEKFRFDFAGTVSAGTMSLRVTLPSGEAEYPEIPEDVPPRVMDLRAKMYSRVSGTWFGLTLTSSRPGRYSVDFNNDAEPDSPAIKPEDYARDLQQFPRAPDRTPDWLRRKIEHAQPVK